MYHARESYKPVSMLAVESLAIASCLAERRVRFDEMIPSNISTNVNQRDSACQNRVAMNAQAAATMNSVIGTPRTQASRASWSSFGPSIRHQTMNPASIKNVIVSGPAQKNDWACLKRSRINLEGSG